MEEAVKDEEPRETLIANADDEQLEDYAEPARVFDDDEEEEFPEEKEGNNMDDPEVKKLQEI